MSEKIFPDTLLTTAGRQMIVDSQGGSTLTFTRVALGDGVLAQGQDQSALTAIISEKLSANISSYTDNEDGTFSLIFSVNNSTLDVGFMHREIGIMAKVDDGEEQLYAYTNAGNAATFLYDKTTPIQERVVRIDFVVGSAENLSVEIDGSVVYPTRGEVQQMIGTHNTGSDSHAELLHLRRPSTAYAVGDIAYSPLLPSWAYLECTVGGTTDSGDLPVPSSVVANDTFADGTVTWKIRKVGFDNEQELATKANRDLSNLTQAGQDSFLERDFTIIYPNGGTEANPANVAVNSRYVESNPFDGYCVACIAEVFYDNQWGAAPFVAQYLSSGSSTSGGIAAIQLDNGNIVIQTGIWYILRDSNIQGNPFNRTAGPDSTAYPCRVKVWKIGKVASA